MSEELSWDEFRLVRAVADARSLIGAAERLGVNPSTVFRRLAAVETAVGARLFERSRVGYEPTAAGQDMIELAATMAESIADFERRVAGRDAKPTGELTVTAPGSVGLHFLPAILARFQACHPGVVVDLLITNQPLDLARRDADVAIRISNDPPDALVGRRICAVRWAVYRRREADNRSAFVGYAGALGPASARRWIEDNVDPERIVARANTAYCMLELARLGFGAALLPCFLGDADPALARSGYILPELDAGLWMLTHGDLRRAARVRAFMDLAGVELTKHRRAIEGEDM